MQGNAESSGFVPGLKLSSIFYEEGVRPILERHFPDLLCGAGRVDYGSEVLGFDTPRSMDHDWGPRLTLFLPEARYSQFLAADISRVLGEELPFEIRGVSTHFARAAGGSSLLSVTDERPINHGVAMTTLRAACQGWLGIDLDADGEPALRLEEWLTMPEQELRAFTSGAVFRDDTGELARVRKKLRCYPLDVWLYLLAAGWRRIEQEEPFMGRCGQVGDDLGSHLVAARLVHEVMHLCFLMERQYAPYSKWFGTAFARLACAPDLSPPLQATLAASTWQDRERHLSTAYAALAEMHNALGLTPPIEPHVSPFRDRPFQVIHGDRFWQALRAVVVDTEVQRLMADPHAIIGSTTQWADSTDVRARRWDAPLQALYGSVLDGPQPA